jgi:hypothetical protein
MEARSLEALDADARSEAGAPASISGIEQEYAVWREDRQVPFAPLLGAVLPNARARGFGEDPLARVRGDGAVWTADGPHAEIATPPRRLASGIAGRLADDALHQREMLLRRLRAVGAAEGGLFKLRGYSTHINAFCRAADLWTVVRRFGVLYGPAVMLIADRRDSPGLLIRPRPDRLEVGTEYLEKRDDIVSAALLVLSATIDCWSADFLDAGLGGETATTPGDQLRPLDATAFRTTWQRPGIFIDRAAFGEDLYRSGRDALLRLADGGSERAGARLEAAWARLRPIASTMATAAELAAVDARVDGRVRLPSERGAPLEPPVHRGHRVPLVSPGSNVALLRAFKHGAVQVEPAVLDWEASLLRIRHPGGMTFARVPRDESAEFAAMVRGGGLEPALAKRSVLGAPPVVTSPQDRTSGLFDELAPTQEEADRRRVSRGSGDSTGFRPGVAAAGSIVSLATSAAFGALKATTGPLTIASARPPRPGRPWFRLGGAGLAIALLVGWLAFAGRVPDMGPSVATPSASSSATCPVGVPGTACPSPSESAVPSVSVTPGPSATTPAGACLVGAVCPSGSPGPTATPCQIGVPCGSGGTQTVGPSVRPTPRPTPRPTRKPTPSPTLCNPAFQAC